MPRSQAARQLGLLPRILEVTVVGRGRTRPDERVAAREREEEEGLRLCTSSLLKRSRGALVAEVGRVVDDDLVVARVVIADAAELIVLRLVRRTRLPVVAKRDDRSERQVLLRRELVVVLVKVEKVDRVKRYKSKKS